jgi:hypothetical protein
VDWGLVDWALVWTSLVWKDSIRFASRAELGKNLRSTPLGFVWILRLGLLWTGAC